MYLIKRYSNRRLYDPQVNRSITLADLAALIKTGQKIKVIESQTGKDVTARVFGQTFVHDLKKWKNAETKIEALKLIIGEGENLMDILKKTYLASLGLFEVTKTKAEEIVDDLIKKGELKKGERGDAIMELVEKAQTDMKALRDKISSEVEDKLKNLKMARKSDLERLETKVDNLMEAMAKLDEKLGGAHSKTKKE